MGLFTSFRVSAQSRRITQLGQQIAQRCCAAVWSKVQHRALAMHPSEARGYLRAHAAPLLRAEVGSALAAQKAPLAWQPKVAEVACETVVETLLREVIRVQKTTTHRRLAA